MLRRRRAGGRADDFPRLHPGRDDGTPGPRQAPGPGLPGLRLRGPGRTLLVPPPRRAAAAGALPGGGSRREAAASARRLDTVRRPQLRVRLPGVPDHAARAGGRCLEHDIVCRGRGFLRPGALINCKDQGSRALEAEDDDGIGKKIGNSNNIMVANWCGLS